MRVGALISGNGSTLQALMDCRDSIDLAVVISNKSNAYGLTRARRNGVPVEILPPELRGAAKKEEAENWILEKLDGYRVQKVFLAGFMKIISSQFIKKFDGRLFNIHPSLLPKYKGLNAFESALDAGDRTAGVTVHHVVADVDSGRAIMQHEFEIPLHRNKDLSGLWLHINEQRIIRESMRKIRWLDQRT
jgi:phosphoribosylglycinamide formyltransferase 1